MKLDISKTSLRRILRKDLGMTPYKIELVQQLKSTDHPMRFCFAKWAHDRLDEAHLVAMSTSKIGVFGARRTHT